MNTVEKKIVTSVLFGVSIIVGFCTAEVVYNTGWTGYLKLFHKDLVDETIKELLENQ